MVTWELGEIMGFTVLQNIRPGASKNQSSTTQKLRNLIISFDYPHEVILNQTAQLVLHLQNENDIDLNAEVSPKPSEEFVWVGKSKIICTVKS